IQVTGGRTFNSSVSYSYSGSVAQSTGDGLPSSVSTLAISNAAGVTLTSATTVTSELQLNSGTFTNGSNLTMGNGSQITRGSGILSTVPTFGSSVFVRYFGGSLTTDKELPISTSILSGIILIGSGTVTLGADCTANGTLSILTSQNLAIGAHTLTLNNNTISATSTCTLVGGATSNLVFGGVGGTTLPSITLNNLTINRSSSTVTLGGATSVAGALTLSNGVL